MIKMDDLKKMCAGIGFCNIQTYIQSGNIVFNSKQKENEKISILIKTAIEKTFGFEVPVITMSIDELMHVIGSNPFLKGQAKEESCLHVTFLSDEPLKEHYKSIRKGDYKKDEFELIGKAVYLYCSNSYSSSKLTNSFFENKLKVIATTRNWKTVNELLKIADKIGSN